MNSLERFKRRKKIKKSITVYSGEVDEELVQKFLNSEVNEEKINKTFEEIEKFYDISVSDDEAQKFLLRFKKEFNEKRFEQLISDCKKEVISSIITPFGLGRVVSAYDKAGGNVNTIHNVRNGTYANEEYKKAYNNQSDYNSDEYHKHEIYIATNRKNSQLQKEGNLEDYMTGKKLDKHSGNDLDHVVSAKEIHDDAGRVLAGINGAVLANRENNLKATSQTNNRSKKADSMESFIKRKNENLKEINKLKSKNNLTENEQNRLRKLNELQKINDKKALESDKKARKEIEEKINKTYYMSDKFIKDLGKASATEGTKMGFQQALGLVITEFFVAFFDEIIDIYKNGFKSGFDNDGFFKVLKERLVRIKDKIMNKWKDVAIAFKDGFLSGFLSNLVTTAINAFVTTGKRVVRIIREGLFSLFKAIKLLVFPPENMTFSEAMHEVKKLIATGLIISIGVIVEEYIDKMIRTTVVLEPFADILTSIFVGAMTGLAVTMVVYYIDKKKNDKEIFNALVDDTNKTIDRIENLLYGGFNLKPIQS